MNPITGYLIAVAIAAIAIGVISALNGMLKKAKEEKKEAEEQIQKQNKTIAELLRHAEEISIIAQDKGKVENEIKKAKTDEELVEIANAIISVNNDRLRK